MPTGDGVWFGVDGEGGSSSDYYCFEADDTGTVSALPEDLAGLIGRNNTHPVYQFLFPAPLRLRVPRAKIGFPWKYARKTMFCPG